MENHVTCSETGNHEDKWMPNTLNNYIQLTYVSDQIYYDIIRVYQFD